MAYYWIQSAYNLSDMLSKHWDHPSIYPMILRLLLQEETSHLSQRKQQKKNQKKITQLKTTKKKRKENH